MTQHTTSKTPRIEQLQHPDEAAVSLLIGIPGVSYRTAQVILAEIGTDMSRFPTPPRAEPSRDKAIHTSVFMSLAVTSCGRENGVGLVATSTLLWSSGRTSVWCRGPDLKGRALLLRARGSDFRFPDRGPRPARTQR